MRILVNVFFYIVLLVIFSDAEIIKITDREISKVNRNFFGVNSLYWVENDQTRNDTRLIESLKEAKVKIIRYPGGEVADNFNWRSNTLNNPKSFPYSKSPYDAKERMDFDEFIKWKNKIGADAIIVVNLEEGFVEGNIEKAAESAAAWVRYANVEKKYGIKYWEIGNESYHLGTRYALKSREYAKALKLFSRKMKAVDPTIKIGAIGPWDYKAIPLIDILPREQVEQLRKLRTSRERKQFKKRYKKTHIHDKRYPSWWSVLADEASGYFDFAVVHRYTGIRKSDGDLAKKLKCKSYVNNLRKYLKDKTGRSYPIALTEYNVAGKSGKRLSKIVLSLTLAEMMGNYLEAGVEIANYWPLRLKSKRALLGIKTIKKKPPYYVFKAFSTLTEDYVLAINGRNKRVYAFATTDDGKRSIVVFLVNKKNTSQKLDIVLPSYFHPVQSWEIDRDDLRLHQLKHYNRVNSSKTWSMDLDPLSLTIIRFEK